MKKSANYALEVYGEKSAEGQHTWFEIEDGFISPVAALEYAKEKKVKGVVRVVRIASDLFGGDVVTPEPIYSLKKISADDKPKGKPGRKPRQPKQVKVNSEPVLTNTSPEPEDLEPEPPVSEEEDIPPVPDPIALG